SLLFFFHIPSPASSSPLSLHDALPILVSVDMDFGYHQAFGEAGHEAYETLLLDCMLGDATLFTRSDEVEAAWSVVDPIIEHWERSEEHTSELQSLRHLVCRLLLEKKKT